MLVIEPLESRSSCREESLLHLLMEKDTPFVRGAEAGLDLLPDVELVHQVVPGGVFREILDHLAGLFFDRAHVSSFEEVASHCNREAPHPSRIPSATRRSFASFSSSASTPASSISSASSRSSPRRFSGRLSSPQMRITLSG